MNVSGIKYQFEDGARVGLVICRVPCESAQDFQVHIRGCQHKKVGQILKETLGGKVDNPVMNSAEARTLDEYIMSWNTDEPLIGLNYVIEYQRDAGREPIYECILCDFIGYLRIFVSHLGGFKHRVNYMSKEYPDMMKLDGTKLKEEELSRIVKERAAIIEKLEGNRSIQVVRGQDPPSTTGTVERVPLLSNSWQQEWERNPSRMEQDMIEGTVNPREQSMGRKIMFSTPREDGQYGANVSTSMYSDWRRDKKDLYGENVGATDRFAENRMQFRENISRGHTDWSRDIKGQYVKPTEGYDQCSNQRMDDRGAMNTDRIQEPSGYADWRRVHQQETENYIRSSDRYSNIRNDEQPLNPGDGRGTDYRRDDRQYEDKCRAREQIGKSDRWMERKSDFSQQKFSDVGDFKRKKMYDYLQNFQIKSEDDASFVLKITKTFKDALIRYYQKKETDPGMRATLDQRTTRSIGTSDVYSRYNPDVPAAAVRDSESSRGIYNWKQDSLGTNLRRSHDPTLYRSSTRDSSLYSSSSRGYPSNYKSNTRDANWGTNANNSYH